MRIIWQTVRRITNEIMGVKGLTLCTITPVVHTVLFTFPMELTKRICLTIRRFLNWWLFSLILMTFTFHSRVVLWGEIRCQFPLSPSKVLKDLTTIIISMTTGNMWPPPNMNLKNGSVKLNFSNSYIVTLLLVTLLWDFIPKKLLFFLSIFIISTYFLSHESINWDSL